MRVFNQGAFYRVTVSRNEVADFRQSWPCSELPDRGISFTFDKGNGDLVDLYPFELDGADVLALSHDAGNYGATKLKLPEYCRR